MSNHWLRLWHDMPNDPKFRTVARISNQRIGDVQAVFLHLLVSASQHVTRGHVDVTTEDLASAIDVTDDVVQSILDAMQGRMMDGDRLTGWSKRQPKREDAGTGDEGSGAKSAAERQKERRERLKLEKDARVTNVTENVTRHEKTAGRHENGENRHDASVTKTPADGGKSVLEAVEGNVQVVDFNEENYSVTQCRAASRNVTLDTDTDTDTEKENTHTAGVDQASVGTGAGRSVCVLICQKMQEAGVKDANPADASLAVLVGKGADVAMFVDAAAVALEQEPPKGFAYALGVVKNKLKTAAALAAAPMAAPVVKPAKMDVSRVTVPGNPDVVATQRLLAERAATPRASTPVALLERMAKRRSAGLVAAVAA